MVYANDRDPIHSGPYAAFGHMGKAGDNPDPTIPKDEPGHPIAHEFTNAIPSSQCIVCHMHQPNSFVNTYYGYQMWAYDTDGEGLWPEKTEELSDDEWFDRLDRNPEGAALRGKWGDPDFLANVSDLNPTLKHTQLGGLPRARLGLPCGLQDRPQGQPARQRRQRRRLRRPRQVRGRPPRAGQGPRGSDDGFAPKPGKPVHMMDIHAERGMHCVDCHFSQDAHGDGTVYAEIQGAVEISCQDCHGTVSEKAKLDPFSNALITSGPASNPERWQKKQETQWNEDRFYERDGELWQRSSVYPDVEWRVIQVKDTVTSGHADYNELSMNAKSISAHGVDQMECHTCHTAWMTSCFGCHLPQEANVRSDLRHFSGETPQPRDLQPAGGQGRRVHARRPGRREGNRIAPVRSSSAVMLSSQDGQRQTTYGQQLPTAANGMSSQCFNTHFAHTVRTTETKTCVDCHPSAAGDNNAWLAQTYLLVRAP